MRQHDAQEFLIFILDLMTDELNFHRNAMPYSQIAHTDEQLDARNKLPLIQATHKQWNIFEQTDNSRISSIFGGLDMTSNTCQSCGYISKRWTPFQCLNVNFPPECQGPAPVATVGLNQLFNYKYGRAETVNGVDCQNCKKKVNFIRSDRLAFLPDYLVISLVRFDSTGSQLTKVKTRVVFQERDIDISQFWFEERSMQPAKMMDRGLQPPFQYECYAAVAHDGAAIDHGHYSAFARSPDQSSGGAGSWHCFSDTHISKSSWERIQSQDLTILFLKRQGI